MPLIFFAAPALWPEYRDILPGLLAEAGIAGHLVTEAARPGVGRLHHLRPLRPLAGLHPLHPLQGRAQPLGRGGADRRQCHPDPAPVPHGRSRADRGHGGMGGRPHPAPPSGHGPPHREPRPCLGPDLPAPCPRTPGGDAGHGRAGHRLRPGPERAELPGDGLEPHGEGHPRHPDDHRPARQPFHRRADRGHPPAQDARHREHPERRNPGLAAARCRDPEPRSRPPDRR